MGKFGEIDSADTRAEKFPLVPMGGRAKGPACADTGARTPIGARGNFLTVIKSDKRYPSMYSRDKLVIINISKHIYIYLDLSMA